MEAIGKGGPMTGIIVTPEEALALHNKTQTRISRPMKKQPPDDRYIIGTVIGGGQNDGKHFWCVYEDSILKEDQGIYFECPYNVGDEIFVKETFGIIYEFNPLIPCRLPLFEYFHFNSKMKWVPNSGYDIIYKSAQSIDPDYPIKWRPSVHMTQDIARTFLRIISVKAMQVQSISEKEALAEGVIGKDGTSHAAYIAATEGRTRITGIDKYRCLWNSRYAKKGLGWDSNCWMWSWEVERITEPGASSTESG